MLLHVSHMFQAASGHSQMLHTCFKLLQDNHTNVSTYDCGYVAFSRALHEPDVATSVANAHRPYPTTDSPSSFVAWDSRICGSHAATWLDQKWSLDSQEQSVTHTLSHQGLGVSHCFQRNQCGQSEVMRLMRFSFPQYVLRMVIACISMICTASDNR